MEVKAKTKTVQNITSRDDVKEHVWAAYSAGKKINLDHCVYGPATGGNRGYIDETMSYYRLLAGHCKLTEASTVLEVGTHYGGSTLAILAGLRARKSKEKIQVYTMDITDLNKDRLSKEPEVTKVIGDSTELSFIAAFASDLESPKVDLLYIDALKDPAFVLTTIFNVHSLGIRPNWIILDDVQTNDEMRKFWSLIEEEDPKYSFLVSHDYPEIRDPNMGYGIIYTGSDSKFMSSARKLMQKLGCDTRKLGTGFDHDRFNKIKGRSANIDLTKVLRGAPTTDSSAAELSTLYDLSANHFNGDGDIVDVGCYLGATTRFLCEGLEKNVQVVEKRARITALDRFIFDIPNTAKSVAGRANLGESVLPIFYSSIVGHESKVNVIPFPTNTVKWNGRPIEILVAGAVRSPQINAHLLAEFVPCMMVGKSIIIHRELCRNLRPFVTYVFAFLSDHFQLIDIQGNTAILGYKKRIPKDKLLRVIENRFSDKERVELVENYFNSQTDKKLHFAIKAQAVHVALKYGAVAKAKKWAEELGETLVTTGEPLLKLLVPKVSKAVAGAI